MCGHMLMIKPVFMVWALKSYFFCICGWTMVSMDVAFLMNKNLNKEREERDSNSSRIMLQIYLGARGRHYRWDDWLGYQAMRN